jgi:hypothetical protein
MRVVTTDRVGYSLRDRTAFARIINASLQLTTANNSMLILKHRAPAVHAPMI